MAQGNNAQAIAYQIENYLKRVSDAMQKDSLLYDKIDARPTETTSMRAFWWSLDLVPGTKTRQIDPDGGNAGRGAAIVPARAQTSAAFFEAATEMTAAYAHDRVIFGMGVAKPDLLTRLDFARLEAQKPVELVGPCEPPGDEMIIPAADVSDTLR